MSAAFWAAVVGTGIGAGLAGVALMALLRFVQHVAWHYHSGVFLAGVLRTGAVHRVLVLAVAGAVAAAGIVIVRRFFPGARGLGESIWQHSGEFPVRRGFANAVLAMVLVALGAALGREGAPKEASAAIARVITDRLGLSPQRRQLLVACGAGAGLAAVYNVPLGGALFAAEVLLGSLALPTVVPALVTAFVATGVSWIALPNEPTYVMTTFHSTASLLGLAAVAGPLAGVLGAGYVRVIGWARRTGHTLQGWHTVLAALIVFTLLGVAATAFPQLLGNGKDVVQLTLSGQVADSIVGVLLVLRFLATAACLSTGSPGGLFTPTLTLGALFGVQLGALWNHVAARNPSGSYALIGMGAFLAAATLGPLSTAVVLMELTYRAEPLMVALLLAIASATLVARLLGTRSIYAS
jgi:CIC family chloride channel protein